MTGSKQVIIESDNKHEVQMWQNWLDVYGKQVVISDDEGCGCCVHLFKVTGEQTVLNTLPDAITGFGFKPEDR